MNLASANLLRNVGRTPRSACWDSVLSTKKRDQGVPRGPGGPPHNTAKFATCMLFRTRYEPRS